MSTLDRPIRLALALAAALTLAAPSSAQEEDDSDPGSQAINEAIDRGARFLLSIQHEDGSWGGQFIEYPEGATALCVAALLHSGLDPGHQAVQRGAAFVRSRPQRRVYGTTTRILMEDMMGEFQDEDSLEQSVEFIIGLAGSEGYFGYPTDDPRRPPDLSCTQYAILAAWFAAENGIKVPPDVFEDALKSILREQLRDGGWSYHRETTGTVSGLPSPTVGGGDRSSTASMTTAGMSSLLFCLDAVKDSKKLMRKHEQDVQEAMQRGYAWLDENMRYDQNVTLATDQAGKDNAAQWLHYYLYTVERLGSIAELEDLGLKNWYFAGANHLIKTQFPSGAWGPQQGSLSVSGSAFALLFLNRATLTRTGESEYRRKSVLAAKEAKTQEVDLRLSLGQPSTAWIAAFGQEARDRHGQKGKFGLRVAQVRYFVDGQEVATVEGDIAKTSGAERFMHELELAPGKHVVQAIVAVAPESDPSQLVNLQSGEIRVTVDWALTSAQQQTITELGSNLVTMVQPDPSCSSELNPDTTPALLAIDGALASSWLTKADGMEGAWIKLAWQKGIKAEKLVLSPPTTLITTQTTQPDGTVEMSMKVVRHPWPKLVEVIVNGKGETFELTGAHREHLPLSKKSVTVKTLEIKILEVNEGDHPQLTSTGFAEIELLGKPPRKRGR